MPGLGVPPDDRAHMGEKKRLPKLRREIDPREERIDVEHVQDVEHGVSAGIVLQFVQIGQVEVGPGREVRVGDSGGELVRVEHGADPEHALGVVEAGKLGFGVGRGDGVLEGIDAPVEVGEDGLVGVVGVGGSGGVVAVCGEALGALLFLLDAAAAVEEAVLEEAADGGREDAGGVLAVHR